MIRPARDEDLDAIRMLLSENGLLIAGVDYSTFSMPALVYVEDGEVLGFVNALVGDPVSVILDLAVRRDRQREGIGRKLLDAIELALRLGGARAWFTHVGVDNDPARRGVETQGARLLGHGLVYVRSLR